MNSFYFFKLPAALFVFITLASCSTINNKVGSMLNLDTDLTLAFKVDADINPDDSKSPSPLFIRMYELKSSKMFGKANFIDLFEKDQTVLGADMLGKFRLKRLKPGEDRENNFVLNEKTKYVGLYAEFVQYKNAKFKIIIPVVQHNVVGSSATIQISSNTLTMLESSQADDGESDMFKSGEGGFKMPEAKIPEIKVPEFEMPGAK